MPFVEVGLRVLRVPVWVAPAGAPATVSLQFQATGAFAGAAGALELPLSIYMSTPLSIPLFYCLRSSPLVLIHEDRQRAPAAPAKMIIYLES